MDCISDIIENYIKEIIKKGSGIIELRRSQLASQFHCVPSQINYVISTRFTLEQGYLVESKRGGGGYIRIQKIILNKESLLDFLLAQVGSSMTQVLAERVIALLEERDLITNREAILIKNIILRDTIQLSLVLRDEVRARIMKMVIMTLFVKGAEENALSRVW